MLQELVRALRVAGFRATKVMQPCATQSGGSSSSSSSSSSRGSGTGGGSSYGNNSGSGRSMNSGGGLGFPSGMGASRGIIGPILIDILVRCCVCLFVYFV